MTCPACARAEVHPQTGIYQAKCEGCAARALAQSPEFAEAAKSGVLTPRYRMALAEFFSGREQEGHERVMAWAQRKKAGVTA